MKKSLGQHFLHDQNIIRQIITLIAPNPVDNLVEIGPGHGALTTKVLPLVDNLTVIELDQDLIPILRKNCQDSPKLQIYNDDVLKVDFTKFHGPIRLIGNLPYNISTPLLFYLIKYINLIKDMHFMLQKEVAERIVAQPGTKIYGRLSVMVQYYFEVTMLLKVGPGVFTPPPKVDSGLVRFIPRKIQPIAARSDENLELAVKLAFNQRRKIIANSLKSIINLEQLKTINLNPMLRPEQLTVDQFVQISNLL